MGAKWPTVVTALAALLVAGERIAISQPAARKPGSPKSPRARKAEKQVPPVTLSPAVFLIRDPLVIAELQLTAAEQLPLAAFAPSANEEAWKLRDLAPEAGTGNEAVQRLNDLVESNLSKLLTAGQNERLEQIVFQVQGPAAMVSRKLAERLRLAEDQVERIATLSAANQAGLQDLRSQMSKATDRGELYRRADKLRSDLQRDLLDVLTAAQRNHWLALQGKPVDLAKLQILTALAPELRDVDTWINSPPLTFAQLRGQVVVLHFWTFG